MSEKIMAMALTRLRAGGHRRDIQWADIVRHDPTGRLAYLRGGRCAELNRAARKCGFAKAKDGRFYDIG